MVDLKQLVQEVKKVAIETGYFLKEERAKFDRSAVQEKGPHDYVSYVDKASEQRLVAQLSLLLPNAGFITEEKTTQQYVTEEYCWVIDPLDGTTNFIHDMAPYCVSIALRNKHEVLLGVVYEVCRDECFWAYKGGGILTAIALLLPKKKKDKYLALYLELVLITVEPLDQCIKVQFPPHTDLLNYKTERFCG